MDNNTYLIPANSKKSLLIFGVFNITDLIMFGSGLALSLILLMVLPVENLLFAVIALAPASVTGLLVMPIPNYHNVLTILKEVIIFYTERQKFVWKGWCYNNGEENKE